jgi:hypothetical protein
MAQDSEVKDGTEEKPNSESSNSKTGQRSSSAETDVVAQLNKLQTEFDKLSRRLQGEKDRAVKQTNQRLDVLEGDIRTVLQQAAQQGKTVTDVLSDMDEAEERETRQLLVEMARTFKNGGQQSGSRQEAQSGVDVSEVVNELGLDTEDASVKAFMAKSHGSLAEAYREGGKLLRQIAFNQPSDGDQTSHVARKPAPASSQEKLMQEYREGSKGLTGRNLIMFKQQMREKGLEIS